MDRTGPKHNLFQIFVRSSGPSCTSNKMSSAAVICLNIATYCAAFCVADRLLTRARLEGVYYLLHAIHNGLVVWSTAGEVWDSLMSPLVTVHTAPVNYHALSLVFALHFYHIALYWRKFRFDDWLHHALMIGVALPIGAVVPAGTLLGFSLFFTTGLPGGIDYALLFLTRNGWLARTTEKAVNAWLAVWVRSPGCVAQATLTLAVVGPQLAAVGMSAPPAAFAALLTAVLNYWNGQYFMEQVVRDATLATQQRHVLNA
jgi:hypothetical protein